MAELDLLTRISRQYPVSSTVATVHTPQEMQTAQGEGFGTLLRQELQRATGQTAGISFSKHAISRVEERGIEVTEELVTRLAGTVQKAQEKGATNILALNTQSAFIINVPNAKVITAISQNELKENIFTNIDSAVFL